MSFDAKDGTLRQPTASSMRCLCHLAVSLGGTEALIEHPGA